MKLYCGDCLKVLPTLESNSVHAVITDPPYGLEFMGKEWDSFKPSNSKIRTDRHGFDEQKGFKDRPEAFIAGTAYQEWCFSWATECLRVLKTGGFLLCFGGTRTHHRLTCALEDAGFIIRDELMWGYASGFPKAQNLAMLISKREGAVREGAGSEGNTFPLKPEYREMSLTENGKRWVGWKTPALKPAWEPIILAQKPCAGSITENVLKHEVGAFNIDACRIPYENQDDYDACDEKQKSFHGAKTIGIIKDGKTSFLSGDIKQLAPEAAPKEKGRFPSNLILTDPVLENGANKFFLIPKTSAAEKHDGGKNQHPTVKPIALMKHLIKLVTREGQLVLDPFVGSGTTLLACRELRRDCVGIEKNEEYCGIARARFGETLGDKLVYEVV